MWKYLLEPVKVFESLLSIVKFNHSLRNSFADLSVPENIQKLQDELDTKLLLLAMKAADQALDRCDNGIHYF